MLPAADPRHAPQRHAAPRHVGFLLLPGFPLMSYASAVEPLRGAGVLAGHPLYRWSHYTFDGAPARASNGIAIAPDGELTESAGLDMLFVCAGGNPAAFDHRPTFARLRGLAAGGLVLGAMSGGAYVLARAGLLNGRRCTIHWEHIPALVEEFPHLQLERTLWVFDRDRISCAGGLAAFDMMVEMIARQHGPELAIEVGDWYLHSRARSGGDAQRSSLRERLGVANPRLLRVLAMLEQQTDVPPDRASLAKAAGVTPRQLDRLFAAHLGTSLGAYSLGVRLERARALLRQTGLAVAEVAVACGFIATGHFARAYRARFGLSPRQDRGGTAALAARAGGKGDQGV
ncbi:MAG TPA: GlxA family transcriptional regulator [Xanthobacteraceae bacterium]|nr:GlxA family transcriptional regulator [Xanthobacteraceae bacterium]